MDAPISIEAPPRPATANASCGPEQGGAQEQCGWEGAGAAAGAEGGPHEAKPFLGGYRHTVTGVHYHHACTQTPLPPRPPPAVVCTSEAQTVGARLKAVQTTADAATQCPRPGWYEDTSGDRVLLPNLAIHETAAQVLERRRAAVLVIQRMLRGWLARRRVAEMRQAKQALEVFGTAQAEQRKQQEEERRAAEIKRRLQPRTADDFAILYSELQTWWGQEEARIKGSDDTVDGKHTKLTMLLAKETKLLQTIDKLKVAAVGPNRAHRAETALKRMVAPRQWALANGQIVEVTTPRTLRAADLAQTYRTLVNTDAADSDARMAVLLKVKASVVELNCGDMTKEAVQLIERELDLLARGRNPNGMEGLRLRIANSFLELIKSPEFNAAATVLANPITLRRPYKFTERNAQMQENRELGLPPYMGVQTGVQTA